MSFGRILRSSALMGGAQVVVLAAGFVRAKVIALILGASGVGLIGIFNVFSGNVATFAGWGLGTSGVRLIAGASEEEKPAKIAAVRRMGWTLSLLGLALAFALFWPVGLLTFDSAKYAAEMAIVALAVPCVIASSGWSAVLQASGKIASLAKVQIAGALAGLLIGLPAVFLWGTIGIALSILFAAAVPAFVLWRAARAECHVSAGSSPESADLGRLVKLGGALMLVGWLGQLSAYVVRLAIVRSEGLDAAGYYQAAFTISGSLPGFVFAAMGADFFPRVAAAKDEEEARQITEKQILAGLLLGVPVIIGLLTLGKLCVHLLYANSFDAAIPLLTWMTWGVFVRIIAWPLGFRLLARGSAKAMITIEGLSAAVTAAVSVGLLHGYGLLGCVVGFLAGQLFYASLLVALSYRQSARAFEAGTFAAIGGSALLAGLAQFFVSRLDGDYWGILPTLLAAGASGWAFRRISQQP
jgi:enterobacterial common antigen flippase